MINVLIAEDDFRISSIHEEFLSKIPDIKVIGKALNAADTMEILKNKKVDLLLLDIYLPDQLGTTLLPVIRERYPEVDLIMITASHDKHLLEVSIRYGVLNYLIKPVNFERFKETIDDYKNKKNFFDSQSELKQSIIDDYFKNSKLSKMDYQKDLPKGIDALTLMKVKSIMTDLKSGITAKEMGGKMGASRSTARRYLEFLVSQGEGKAEQEYGIVGRPERKYYPHLQ